MGKDSLVKNTVQRIDVSLHEGQSTMGFTLSGGRLMSIFETIFARTRDISKVRKIILKPMGSVEQNHV